MPVWNKLAKYKINAVCKWKERPVL